VSPRIIAIGLPQAFRQQVARAVGLEPEDVEWMPSVAAAEGYLSERPVDVLVLSPTVKEADAFGLAEYVGRSAPATAVLLVRERTLNGLLPAAMRAGIRDVVDLSRGGDELRDALRRAITWADSLRSLRLEGKGRLEEEQGSIISIFSSKGGTGKTFLSCNLAVALAQKTKRDVAVFDLDLDVGDVYSYFGREPTHPLQDLLALGDEADRDTVLQMGDRFGDHLYGYGAVHDPAAPPAAAEAMGKLLRNLRRTFRYTVVDATADYSDAALSAFDLSDTICLITGLDVVGVRHLSLAIQTLLSLGYPRERFRIVMNRADSKVGLSAADVQRVTKIRVDAMIPSSRLVPMSLNRGRPVLWEEPRSEVSKAIVAFAEKIAAERPAVAEQPRQALGRG
jgi:pilus assembly protein CpaE